MPVKWFYYLLLLLEGERLCAIDYETVRLLVIKMRVKVVELPEYANLELIKELLNKSHVVELVKMHLKPNANQVTQKQHSNQQNLLFGLTNH